MGQWKSESRRKINGGQWRAQENASCLCVITDPIHHPLPQPQSELTVLMFKSICPRLEGIKNGADQIHGDYSERS